MKNIIISLCLFFFLFLIPNTVKAGPCTDNYYTAVVAINTAAAIAYEACERSGICEGAVVVAQAYAAANNTAAWAACCGLSLGYYC